MIPTVNFESDHRILLACFTTSIEIVKLIARITSKNKIVKLQNRETGESINKTK